MPNFFHKAAAFIVLPALFAATTTFPFSCSLARDGGIFRSDDFGTSWQQKAAIKEGKSFGSRDILSLGIESVNPDILYMGTNGDGLYKSFDSGETWQKMTDKNNILDKRASVYDIAINPGNQDLVYAAVAASGSGNVLRSQDGGESFEEIYVISDGNQRVNDIEINNVDDSVIYIGTSQGGILKSIDRGRSWQAVKWFDSPVLGVKLDPRNNQTIYAVIEEQGILKSVDAGRNFQLLKIEQQEDQNSFKSAVSFGNPAIFLIDLFDSKILYVSIANKIFISRNEGESFKPANILLPPDSSPITAMAQDPNFSNFYYSVGSVLFRTSDTFKSWTTHQISSSRHINFIKIDPLDSNIIYVGMSN